MTVSSNEIGCIVLAAGLSSRMGRCKALLPWGDHSVIEHILSELGGTNLRHRLVVTGAAAEQVTAKVNMMDVVTIHNPDYATGEMLSSLKVGLLAQPESVSAALVVLGDQPRLQAVVVRQVMEAYRQHKGKGAIIAPRYQGQRGHPVLISRKYWDEVLALPDGGAPRDVIQRHPEELYFVDVETDSVLSDIDTPEDYEHERQCAGLVG